MASDSSRSERPRSERFPPRERVTLRRDYDRAYRSGLRCWSRHLVLHAAPNGLDHARLGLTVSRKVGGAVVRNRLRRRLRAAYRTNRDRFPAGYDVVIGAKPTAATAPYRELLADLLAALPRLPLDGDS